MVGLGRGSTYVRWQLLKWKRWLRPATPGQTTATCCCMLHATHPSLQHSLGVFQHLALPLRRCRPVAAAAGPRCCLRPRILRLASGLCAVGQLVADHATELCTMRQHAVIGSNRHSRPVPAAAMAVAAAPQRRRWVVQSGRWSGWPTLTRHALLEVQV